MGELRSRKGELGRNLEDVYRRIDDAARSAGRSSDTITLVVVTKTWPASDVAILVEHGVRDVGENRDQEAAPKARELATMIAPEALPTWHFIGQLQTNKVRSVVQYCTTVQSVDRPRLARALSKSADESGRDLRCLVQVSLDDEPGRGGAVPDEVAPLADLIASSPGLTLQGLMAVAPLDQDPQRAFERLAAIRQQLLAAHPEARWLSAGMSDDLEAAISFGATHVRLGRAVLGHRPPVG